MMRRLLVVAGVMGTGALGFAAASQAGMSLGASEVDRQQIAADSLNSKFSVPECRIQKTLSYDFNGNPYVKKVRVCA